MIKLGEPPCYQGKEYDRLNIPSQMMAWIWAPAVVQLMSHKYTVCVCLCVSVQECMRERERGSEWEREKRGGLERVTHSCLEQMWCSSTNKMAIRPWLIWTLGKKRMKKWRQVRTLYDPRGLCNPCCLSTNVCVRWKREDGHMQVKERDPKMQLAQWTLYAQA